MVGVTTESMTTLETVMKPAIMPFAVLMSACGGQGPMRRALTVAAVVTLAACGGDGATEVRPDTTGSIRGTVTNDAGCSNTSARTGCRR